MKQRNVRMNVVAMLLLVELYSLDNYKLINNISFNSEVIV